MFKFMARKFSFLPKDVVIVAAKRTPFGSFMGSLSSLSSPTLASHAIRACIEQSGLQSSNIDHLIMGNVYSAGVGQAPSRQACIHAGLPESVVCYSVNKVCSSGMKSITLAAQEIALGSAEIVVAGGMDAMSQCPFLLPNYRSGQLIGDGAVIDSLMFDGLTCPFNKTAMGNCNEKTNQKYNITREDQDKFCIESYTRSTTAWDRGYFNSEVVPVEVPSKKESKVVKEDEEFRKVKLDKIPTLRPVFEKNGTITAANASTINDGACTLILMSAEKAKAMNVKPLAKVRAFADHECEPVHFGVAPAGAMPLAMKRAGVDQNQVDLFEINEAFSSVVLANMKILDLPHSKVNVNGGAVSLGHPVGASGARITATLVYALKEKNLSLGVAGICNGGGGATAIVIENV